MKRGDPSIFERIEKSRLLSEAELSEARSALDGERVVSDAHLLNRLVDFGLLTAWQGLQLLTGRKSFFIGPYKLLLRIGQGGAAVVYKAQHTRIGHIVALKVFSESLMQGRDAAARFRREAQASVRVNHPHVVSGYGSKFFDGRGVLVMEFVEGDDLARWQKRCGTLPIDWCCEAARQAALGLAHIHQRGLVHRDLKPSNLLATGTSSREAPHVKVADLGAANIKFGTEFARTQLTALGALLGTPNYMAPEQITDGHAADHRADIFGLGCTLFKLLTDELPWTGTTLEERLKARMTEQPLRVRQFRGDAPPLLEEIVEAMLARQPERRPCSADQVATDLAEFARVNGAARYGVEFRRAESTRTNPGPAALSPAVAPSEAVLPVLRIRPREAETLRVPSPRSAPTAPQFEWRLLRISVQGPPETFLLRDRDTVILGRGRNCHIRVRDVQVSRRHCSLSCRDGRWCVEDLGSQNGTYVNGQPTSACDLKSGDQIHIGSTRFWIVAMNDVDSLATSAGETIPRRSGPATA